MVAVAAVGLGLVVYLVVALVGGSGPDPAPRGPGGAESTAPGGGAERPVPALEPRRGAGPHTLEGTVVDAAGGPVAGAWVTALPDLATTTNTATAAATDTDTATATDHGPLTTEPDPDTAVVAETDSEGRFRLEGLPASPQRLRVEGAGILTAEVRLVDPAGPAVRILVARETSIAGRVVGLDGRPASGVTVHVLGRAGAPPVERATADDGTFEVGGLPEGRYRVFATAGEWAAPAAPVDRLGGGPHAPITLVLVPAAHLRGRVIDATGGGGLPAQVTLVPEDPDLPPRTARAGADGRFELEGVPFGRVTATAHAPGYVSGEAIRFEALSDHAPVIHLERGAIASGRVVDASGAPVEGALVLARGEGGGADGREVSEASLARRAGEGAAEPASGASGGWQGGGFTASGLPFIPRGELGVVKGPLPFPPPPGAGPFRVAAPVAEREAAAAPDLPVDPELAPRLRTGADGRFRITGLARGRWRVFASHPLRAGGQSAPLEVDPGGEVEGIEIVLGAGLVLHGQVVDERGVAVVGATVTARPRDGAAAVALTGPGGRYRVGPVGGAVTLEVTGPGIAGASRPIAAPAAGARLIEREENITVGRTDAALEGSVHDPGGFAVRGARVSLAGGGPSAAAATTDEAGRFRLDGVAAGRHRVRIEHPDHPAAEIEARTGLGNRLELPLGGALRATVREGGTGAPLPGARVTARGPDGARAAGVAGPDGAVELAPLAAGRWTVEASAPGHARASARVEVSAAGAARSIAAAEVRLELVRVATIAGVVRDHRGERAAGVEISIAGSPVRVTSDELGRFRISDAPSGSISLELRRGAARGSHPLELAPGAEQITLELRLDPP